MKDEEGATTAEFALTLPAVTLILAFLLGAAATGISSLQLEEASRLGARALARGDSQEQVIQLVHSVDEDMKVSFVETEHFAVVTTSKKAPGIIGAWGGLDLKSEAKVPREQSRQGRP